MAEMLAVVWVAVRVVVRVAVPVVVRAAVRVVVWVAAMADSVTGLQKCSVLL